MKKRKVTKLIHAGEYAAEVEVELVYTDDEWSPYLSVADAARLDQVRRALQTEDIDVATRFARVYRLLPVAF